MCRFVGMFAAWRASRNWWDKHSCLSRLTTPLRPEITSTHRRVRRCGSSWDRQECLSHVPLPVSLLQQGDELGGEGIHLPGEILDEMQKMIVGDDRGNGRGQARGGGDA